MGTESRESTSTCRALWNRLERQAKAELRQKGGLDIRQPASVLAAPRLESRVCRELLRRMFRGRLTVKVVQGAKWPRRGCRIVPTSLDRETAELLEALLGRPRPRLRGLRLFASIRAQDMAKAAQALGWRVKPPVLHPLLAALDGRYPAAPYGAAKTLSALEAQGCVPAGRIKFPGRRPKPIRSPRRKGCR